MPGFFQTAGALNSPLEGEGAHTHRSELTLSHFFIDYPAAEFHFSNPTTLNCERKETQSINRSVL